MRSHVSRCGFTWVIIIPCLGGVGLATGVCKQPPAAPMQIIGPHVAGFAGVCAHPPEASLQVAALHVAGCLGVG